MITRPRETISRGPFLLSVRSAHIFGAAGTFQHLCHIRAFPGRVRMEMCIRDRTNDHGVPYDIVCGTFFVVGLKEDDFASLTEQQIERYKDKYSHEMILSVPKQPEAQKKPMKKEKHEYER